MSLYSYKVFETVVKMQSFTKAARAMHMTPSAVSHSIAALEKEFGVSLFIRNKSGVVLTPDGNQLMPLISEILRKEEVLKQYSNRLNNLTKGILRIGAFHSVSTVWIPEIMKKFHAEYPDIEVHLYQSNAQAFADWLDDNVIDLAFVADAVTTKYEFEHLYFDPVIAIYPEGSTPKNGEFATVDELRDETLLAPGDFKDFDGADFFAKTGLVPEPKYHIIDDAPIINLGKQGFGVSVLPKLVAEAAGFDKGAFKIKPEFYRNIGLITNDVSVDSPAAKSFKEMVIEYIDEKYGA